MSWLSTFEKRSPFFCLPNSKQLLENVHRSQTMAGYFSLLKRSFSTNSVTCLSVCSDLLLYFCVHSAKQVLVLIVWFLLISTANTGSERRITGQVPRNVERSTRGEVRLRYSLCSHWTLQDVSVTCSCLLIAGGQDSNRATQSRNPAPSRSIAFRNRRNV